MDHVVEYQRFGRILRSQRGRGSNLSINRKARINGIVYYLSILKNSVEMHNSLNHQDINVASENFFRDFLNLAFG